MNFFGAASLLIFIGLFMASGIDSFALKRTLGGGDAKMYPMAKEAAREAEIRELDALLAELFLEAEHINNEYAFFKEKYQFPTVERRDKGFNLYGARMGWSKNQGK